MENKQIEWINFIKCPICFKIFKSLQTHIICIHKLTLNDFKEMFKYKQLICEDLRELMSQRAIACGCGKQNLGKKCSEEHCKNISKALTGKNNPFYGKKHSEETKKRMKENHADFTGENNPLVIWLNKSEKNREVYTAIMRERFAKEKLDLDFVKHKSEALSKSMCQAHLDGKLNFGKNHKHGYFFSEKQDLNIFYRSSYELLFLEQCEKNNEIYKFIPCPFRIEYINNNGNVRNYIPDFFINNLIIIEIKPKSMIKFGNNELKAKAAIDFCKQKNYKFVILTEDNLNIK